MKYRKLWIGLFVVILSSIAVIIYMWRARSTEFRQTDLMNILRWMRVIGDTIFGVGVMVLGWLVLGVKTGWSLTDKPDAVAERFLDAKPQKQRRQMSVMPPALKQTINRQTLLTLQL